MSSLLDAALVGLLLLGGALVAASTEADQTAAPSDTLSTQEFNDRTEARLKRQLGAHETEPASSVFKNLKIDWLKNVPAGDFLGIMNGGYSRALGVRCTHCHVEDDFSSDDLRPKRAAREMASMHHAVNEHLASMENLEGSAQDRFINCATCHRGRIDPHDPPAR